MATTTATTTEISDLPEGCIANVLSLTTPRDAGRLSSVSSTFRSAGGSDAVWRRFLPPDYLSVLARAAAAADRSSSLRSLPLKDFYSRLCTDPVLIDGGAKSFWLDRSTGKKCYMISARDLAIVWGDSPRYWKWSSSDDDAPKSRFPEVATLLSVCWLEVRGKIDAEDLSPATRYAAYIVFSSPPEEAAYGFEHQPVEVGFGLAGAESGTRSVYLDTGTRHRQQQYHHNVFPRSIRRPNIFNPLRVLGPRRVPAPGQSTYNNNPRVMPAPGQLICNRDPDEEYPKYPKERSDKWWEVELGEFTTSEGIVGELEMSVMEVKGGNWKGGLIIQGIEIRPKGDGQ